MLIKGAKGVRKAILVAAPGVGVLVAILVAAGQLEDPSYVLSDFDIKYPGGADHSGNESADLAQVTFVSYWPDGDYPGAAQCEIVVNDVSGAPVGKVDFGLNSGTDGVRSHPVDIAVSGSPVAAEGSCNDLGTEVGGSGYSFELVTITPVVFEEYETEGLAPEEIPSRSKVTFEVRVTAEGADSDFRACFLVVTRTDGSVDPPLQYNILGGGGSMTFEVEGAPETIADATMTSEPFD
jgi:hypothetical protein